MRVFWNVVILYTLTITTFILVGYYGYGWYHIFTGVSSKLLILRFDIIYIVCLLYLCYSSLLS